MIGYLKGTIIFVNENSIILDVNNVGYYVFTNTISLAIGDEITFFIHTYIREDQFSLYGFQDSQSLKLFESLLDVNGVGPKVAITTINFLGFDNLINSILNDDYKSIQSVPGIGKKGAERIVLELKEKLERLGYKTNSNFGKSALSIVDCELQSETITALLGLGYNKSEAKEKLTLVIDDLENSDLKNLTVEMLIKLCLSK